MDLLPERIARALAALLDQKLTAVLHVHVASGVVTGARMETHIPSGAVLPNAQAAGSAEPY